uniref:Expansin-A1 n=1 Tax=Rhizophora mucronata TaxID=61149 RepID=A0A2P2KV81_RHIMU
MTANGACLAQSWSQPPISALQTMLFPTMQGAGATPLCTILISPSLSSSKLPNSRLELCLCPTEGYPAGEGEA